jgi:putative flippase GtrA
MLVQLMRFGSIGILATLTYFICFNGLTYFMHSSPVMASIISYMLSLLVSFVGQAKLTFRAQNLTIRVAAKFTLNSLLGLAIHASFVHIAVTRLHVDKNLGAIAATIFATLLSYIMMRYWIFPTTRQQ